MGLILEELLGLRRELEELRRENSEIKDDNQKLRADIHTFFYKNIIYKNLEPHIRPNFKNIYIA